MKKTNTLIMVFAVVLFASCEDHDTNPVPVIKPLRPERMTYGDFSYRLYSYNDRNQVTAITSGFTAEGETHETLHEIVYEGDRIDKIIVEQDWELDYLYEGDRVSETHEYREGELKQINLYLYDLNGRVKTWATLHDNGEGEFVPLMKTTYAYNEGGNLVRKMQYYHESGHRYVLAVTIEYEDFDDRKSSSALFLTNLYNVYDVKFKNNPRRWRVLNANGSTAEESFMLEYNAQGYVTRERPASGGAGITYHFSSY